MDAAATTPASGTTLAVAKPAQKRKRRPGKLAAPAQVAIVHMDFSTDQGFALAQRRALAYAASSAVPAVFQGGPGSQGFANCLIALELAHRLNFPFLLVAQNLTLVDGRPSWQGKFYVALVQGGGRFRDHGWEVHDEPKPGELAKDTYAKRMFATRVSDGKVCIGEWVSVGMAKQKGWWSKVDRSGVERSHWPSMTGQMLTYRSASFWANAWDPGATMGLRSVEEELDAAGGEPHLVAPPPRIASPAPAQAAAAVVDIPPSTPADPTLDPGEDPMSMNDPLAEVRRAIGDGNRREALAAIGRLPREHRKAGEDLYNAASRRNP